MALYNSDEIEKRIWAMPEKDFHSFRHEMTLSPEFIEMMTLEISSLTNEQKQTMVDICAKHGLEAKNDLDLAGMCVALNKRACAPQ
jgi:hypothetical protein